MTRRLSFAALALLLISAQGALAEENGTGADSSYSIYSKSQTAAPYYSNSGAANVTVTPATRSSSSHASRSRSSQVSRTATAGTDFKADPNSKESVRYQRQQYEQHQTEYEKMLSFYFDKSGDLSAQEKAALLVQMNAIEAKIKRNGNVNANLNGDNRGGGTSSGASYGASTGYTRDHDSGGGQYNKSPSSTGLRDTLENFADRVESGWDNMYETEREKLDEALNQSEREWNGSRSANARGVEAANQTEREKNRAGASYGTSKSTSSTVEHISADKHKEKKDVTGATAYAGKPASNTLGFTAKGTVGSPQPNDYWDSTIGLMNDPNIGSGGVDHGGAGSGAHDQSGSNGSKDSDSEGTSNKGGHGM